MTTLTTPDQETAEAVDWAPSATWESASPPGRTSRLRRTVRGRPEDPAWVRPALLVLLATTAVLYLWDLGASGWANSFYSAAVQAGTKSWKAFFFGSSDAGNFITVDKPPAFLWVMEISARIFGLNSWSILVPQALEGVATVFLVYAAVRRWFGGPAGLLAGAVMALTPVAVLMFRFNNPDALLVLLLTAGTYCVIRGLEDARPRWIVGAFALVGIGFLTKELQAFLVLPAFGVAYLWAAPTSFWRRTKHLLVATAALVLAGGWWVAIVQLWPASDRPYIGGSTDNSILNVIFGYNGFGRITGNETGSVGGSPAGGGGPGFARAGGGGPGFGGPGSGSTSGGPWGLTGLTRMFGSDFGGQISWLLPAALLLLLAGLALTLRARRTDRRRAAFVLWGLSLVVSAVVLSYGAGIIHPYYSLALAPSIAALVGMGTVTFWRLRHHLPARAVLAAAVALTAVWSYFLLRRSPTWYPDLRLAVLVAGAVGAVGILVLAHRRLSRRALLMSGAVGAVALAAGLAGPAAYAVQTAATPHSGSIPSAGPATAGGGFGGFGAGPGGGGPGGRFRFGGGTGTARPGGFSGFGGPGGPGGPGGFGGFGGSGGFGGGTGGSSSNGAASGAPTGLPGGFAGGGFGNGGLPGGRGFGGGPLAGGGAGAGGGLLSSPKPSAAITKALQTDASKYRWVAAAIGSDEAAGYQLASGEPVMAIGGFNGTDPAPTPAQFEKYVADGDIHYYIAGGGFGPGLGQGSTDDAQQINSWVESHYTAETIGGTTVYNLASPARSTTGS